MIDIDSTSQFVAILSKYSAVVLDVREIIECIHFKVYSFAKSMLRSLLVEIQKETISIQSKPLEGLFFLT